jgi:hypothetical protein
MYGERTSSTMHHIKHFEKEDENKTGLANGLHAISRASSFATRAVSQGSGGIEIDGDKNQGEIQ